jgi:hypothetical protein
MESSSVVEHLNPFRNDGPGESSCREDPGMGQLSFEGTEKALADCIILTIGPTTHTTGDLGF